MPIYLDEEETGHDPNSIAYPHLLLCMGVTCLMSDASLIGGHVTKKTTEPKVIAAMKELLDLVPKGVTIDRLYLAGHASKHFAGAASAHDKAKALGYGGIVYLFDTSKIDPADGTFVMVTSNGPGRHPGIEYKRNEKVSYTTVTKHRTDDQGRRRAYGAKVDHDMVAGSEISVAKTSGLFNQLTEVKPPH
jgi:hypothetical protein